MMKWFRKHNKQLLAVFASALLVIWLGGQALEEMFRPNPMSSVIGTAYGESLKGRDYQPLRARLQLLESMGIQWRLPWRNPWVLGQLKLPDRMPQDPLLMAGARPLDRERGMIQWWLLDQEARRMGVTISDAQVKDFLKESGITSEQLTAIRDNMNVSTDEMLNAIAEYLRVSHAAQLASAGVQVTEPEVKDLFLKTNEQVDVRYALLPAEAFEAKDAAATQPVSEAELQDLFSKYKDNLAGAGKYGFGYKLPDRVSVQYVGATIEEVARTLPPVNEDRARRYFEDHKDKFQPQRPATTQPTTQPAVKFEDVRQQVIDQMRNNDAAGLLRSVLEEIRASAWGEFAGSKADIEAGKVPESLKNVLEQRRNEFSASRKIPLVYRQTGLISQEQASKEPGIGQAYLPMGQSRLGFAEYAFMLDKGQKADAKQDEAAGMRLKLWQPVTVREDMGPEQPQAMYIFRVVGEEASHAPATLAEVREQVERDAKTLKAMAKAEAAAKELLATAEKDGLKAAVAAQFPALATRPATTQPTATRPATPEVELFEQEKVAKAHAVPGFYIYYTDTLTFPGRLVGLQQTEPVLKAAFEKAPAASASQPAANRTAMVELPEQKAYVVLEVTGHKPASEPEFDKAKSTLTDQLRIQKLKAFFAGWYDPQQIEKRTGWQNKEEI